MRFDRSLPPPMQRGSKRSAMPRHRLDRRVGDSIGLGGEPLIDDDAIPNDVTITYRDAPLPRPVPGSGRDAGRQDMLLTCIATVVILGMLTFFFLVAVLTR